MFLIKSKKSSEFGKRRTISDDFILMNFVNDKNEYKTLLVGLRTNKRTLVVLVPENSKDSSNTVDYMTKYEKRFDFNIYYIITGLVNEHDENTYILVEKTKKAYNIHYFDFAEQESIFLGDSVVMPFLIVDKDLKRCLITVNQGRINKLAIVNKKPDVRTAKEFEDNVGTSCIRANHSSAFIDLNNDSRPDIALDTEDNGERVLLILLLNAKGLKESRQTLTIPENAGPLIFEDFNRDGKTDLCYVYSDEKGSYLVIHYNQHTVTNETIFSDKNTKTINLGELYPDYSPVTTIANMDDIPGGIFVYDMELKKFPNIVLLMENIKTNELAVKIIATVVDVEPGSFFTRKKSKVEDIKFENYKYANSLHLTNERVVSISCLDPDGVGREGLLLNIIDDGNFKLLYFENNLEVNHYKLSLITLDGQRNMSYKRNLYNHPIPGVSYRVFVDNKTLVNHQMTQSSYLHLKKPIVTFGLGSMNLLIEKIQIGIPYSLKTFETNQKIIPNSDLVITYDNNRIYIELLLKYGFYIKIVFVVLAIVLIINSIFVLFFSYLEHKKKKHMLKSESSAFNFKAL